MTQNSKDVVRLENAKSIFARLVDILNKEGWHFSQSVHDERGIMIIKATLSSDDLPIEFSISVNAGKESIMILSQLPFNMPKDKILDGAIALSLINYSLDNGSFDYNIKEGAMVFRLTTFWKGGLISDEVFIYMIAIMSNIVDRFNDKLFMVSKGAMSLQELAAFIDK